MGEVHSFSAFCLRFFIEQRFPSALSHFLQALILAQGKYEAIEAKFNSSFHWSFPAVQKLHQK